MKRWLRGSVVLATAVGMWSCSGDPTDSFRGGPSRIVASPASLFITEGQTEAVIVQAQDDQGDPLAVTFDTSSGPGITVVEDVTFLPSNGAAIQGQTRYLITANTFLASTFTVRAGGDSLVIPVKSLPVTFAGTFSNPTPALGDTVTLTAPTGITFGAETGITFPGAAGEPVITGISADGTVLSFLPAPGTDTAAAVSGLELSYAPGVPVDTLVTTTKITTPAITELPANFSNANPAVNEAVDVTAPGFLFLPDATVVFGADTAVIVSRAADSSSISFITNPGVTGIPSVSGVVLDFLPAVPLTLPATTTVTTATTFTPKSGTDTPGGAPAIAVPAPGETTLLIDGGTYDYAAPIFGGAFGDFPARLYKFDVAAGEDVTVTLNWASGEDLGVYWFAADGTTEPAGLAPADDGGAGAHPESSTSTFAPGSYRLAVVNFSGSDPAYFSLRLDGAETAAAARSK